MTFVETVAVVLAAGVGLLLLWMLWLAIRHPILFKLGLRNIPRRPAQSLLIVIGLMLSTVIFVSALSLGDTLKYSIQRNAVDAYGAVDEVLAPPVLSLLAGLGDGDAAIEDPETEAEESLNSLLEGGLTSVLTVLEGGLFGISETRYQQLQKEAAEEPLIDAVAGSILFPTILRDVDSGQGEPLGFIFAVDDIYVDSFGLTDIEGNPVAMADLEPGISALFGQVSNLLNVVENAATEVGLEGFSVTDAVIAITAGGAALTTVAGGEGFDLAAIAVDLETLRSLGIDTTPLEEAGIDILSLEALGLDAKRLQELGITDTTIDLGIPGLDTSSLLSAFNLNTLGVDIDEALAQVGLQLRQGDIYLNRLGAEQLQATTGDVLEVYIGPLPVRFRVKAIVEEAGPVGALFSVVMMPLTEAQQLLFMDGKVNNILVSNLGDNMTGLEHTEAVSERLKVLAMDPQVVDEVTAILLRPQVRDVLDREAQGAAEAFAAPFEDGPPGFIGDFIQQTVGIDDQVQRIESLPATLDGALASEVEFEAWQSLLADSDVRTWLNDLPLAEQDADSLDKALRRLNEFDLIEPLNKSTIVSAADVGRAVFSSVFTLFGAFSIIAALLLIFLIFVMLAAERRSEIGISRAIGVQRTNVVQMFIAEGMIYDLLAAALGIILGLGVSYLMIGFIGSLFNNVLGQLGEQSSIFSFYFDVAPTSVVIAYSAGVLLTFFVVAMASWRVSRMNIVAAIRDLPESAATRRESTVVRVLRLLVGPGLLLIGILLLLNGESFERDTIRIAATLIAAGLSFFGAQILTYTSLRKEQVQRWVYTFLGVALIVIWGMPWPTWIGLSESLFDQDPSLALLSFILTGPLVILGAILVIIFNADVLARITSRLFGGTKTLAPVLRTAIAYPLNTRFRTGVTMLLFAMIISTVTIMSVVIDATQTLVEPDEKSTAGFDISTSFSLLSFFDPLDDLSAAIAENPDFPSEDIAAVGGVSTSFSEARQAGASAGDWRFITLAGIDEGYIDQAEQTYSFSARAAGYGTDAEVWQALRERDDVVVVTSDLLPGNSFVDGRGNPHGRDRYQSPLRLDGLDPEDTVLPEIQLDLSPTSSDGSEQAVQVLAILEESETLVDSWVQGNIAILEKLSGEVVSPDTYYIKVSDGADVHEVATRLESAFLGNALDTSILAESNAATQALMRGVLRLFQGFLALGLVVGIAALGVISTRSVVERRQQVGMLRAIGYQSNMVALAFLLESSFIALSGILVGVIGGVILGGDIVEVFLGVLAPPQGFSIPWLQIGLIVLAAYAFSLLTTLLPAYQASRIYPAEALRYE